MRSGLDRARFNALEDLFLIRKKDNESLQSLIHRIDEAMHILKNLRPVDYTLKTQDEELVCMAMLWSQPADFDAFRSSLNLIDNLIRSKLEDAFRNEDITRTRHLEDLPPSDSTQAFVASSGTPGAGTKPKGSRQRFKCDFCGMNGHTEDRCFKRINEQLQGKPSQANAVQEVPQLDSGIVQFAGSASLRSLHPSDPLLPLQLDADVDWNAGTGATSLMTRHRHWVHNY
ncbi:hypothetical protein EW146_g2578 [Bondarzewia mesenterica]|uniref:CCHC-type domain-containing protein n=1 Tax=Bondarzewia mesenterica TaxID=1095465 RepID=A0A4V3XFQ2_9AGAM|nr:hypothetical protein EW146_g2578 [Bondarzewia mesenterica]